MEMIWKGERRTWLLKRCFIKWPNTPSVAFVILRHVLGLALYPVPCGDTLAFMPIRACVRTQLEWRVPRWGVNVGIETRGQVAISSPSRGWGYNGFDSQYFLFIYISFYRLLGWTLWWTLLWLHMFGFLGPGPFPPTPIHLMHHWQPFIPSDPVTLRLFPGTLILEWVLVSSSDCWFCRFEFVWTF
jgi:hypothetical protein